MGNSASKADDDETYAQAHDGNENGKSVLQGETTFENDSLTCPDSKSTLGTEYTGPVRKQAGYFNNKEDHMPTSYRRGGVSRNSLDSATNPSRDHDKLSSHITDDQVHVNLAMADLMAYLQVVANNSNNLPLTRRDDPELGRTVSNLTGDEYARKSAAFVPSDVRVISGSFSRYGRVWDLPTSEEFNACDGAQEPGRSYGGACCNAMLKVLYDSANDATDAAQTKRASEALFDDDEDEESLLGKSVKSAQSLEFAPSNPATISWASLLRLMKAEIQDIEHAQHPTLTTSRKFDLTQPFSIVPPNFDPQKGKKRSLLIGCNYTNIHGAELKASHDDVGSMKDYIVNVHGFPETKGLMTVLLDDDHHKHPTHLNITEAFKALSEQSQPGDAVFVQFSGHGGRVLDSPLDSEAESYDEVIVPSDYTVSGLIRDTLMFKTLLAPMKYGVTVTILIDCCDTGMVLDMPYKWSTRADRTESQAKLSLNDDFSFVRFLKVVRTLYESSTFTQLGKTVGSVLNHNPNVPSLMQKQHEHFSSDMEDEDEEGGVTEDEDHTTTVPHESSIGTNEEALSKSANLGLMASLISCGSPAAADVPKCSSPGGGRNSPEKERASKNALVPFDDEKKEGDIPASNTRSLLEQVMGTRSPLLEQVINCTLAHGEDDYSDDETYNTNHGYSLDGSSTFDSFTDDGSGSRHRQRRRRSRRRR